MKKITIAIDGYSSTGKSTVAKQLAKHLGYVYVDSGAMYRAITYYAIENKLISKNGFDKERLITELPQIDLEFRQKENSENGAHIFLNGKDVEAHIRNLGVSNFVSDIAAIPEVRKKLVAQQQKMGEAKGVVMDGRDIGTVVFPKAELKIFMVAPAEIRAQRRYKELLKKGENIQYEAVLNNIKTRDNLDTTRKDSPLIKAEDALEFDNAAMNLEEQFERLVALAEARIAACSK
jgi:cytidylate kinase